MMRSLIDLVKEVEVGKGRLNIWQMTKNTSRSKLTSSKSSSRLAKTEYLV